MTATESPLNFNSRRDIPRGRFRRGTACPGAYSVPRGTATGDVIMLKSKVPNSMSARPGHEQYPSSQ
jgi:hypothetical protein